MRHTFGARGPRKHQLTEAEINELAIDRRELDLEKESVPLRFPEDFNSDLIQRFREGVEKIHQPSFQNYSDIQVFGAPKVGNLL